MNIKKRLEVRKFITNKREALIVFKQALLNDKLCYGNVCNKNNIIKAKLIKLNDKNFIYANSNDSKIWNFYILNTNPKSELYIDNKSIYYPSKDLKQIELIRQKNQRHRF